MTSEHFFWTLMRSAPFQPATNYWRAIELSIIQAHGLPRGRILDLGCGDGFLTKILNDALNATSCNWIGVDIDHFETSGATSLGFYDTVHTTSAANIPETSESIDVVFSNSVLEHISDINRTISEVSRLLKRGGRFIFTVPGPDFHACLRGPLFGRVNRDDYCRDIDRRCSHFRYWTVQQWEHDLSQVGLRITSSTEYLSEQQVQCWERISGCTGGLTYSLFGKKLAPIEIQRRLGLRSRPGVVKQKFGGLFGYVATIGCQFRSAAPAPRYGCLLLDAVKI